MAMEGAVATRLMPKTAAAIATTLRAAISRRRASSPSQSCLSLATRLILHFALNVAGYSAGHA